MAVIYAKLIKMGFKTIEDVPTHLREDVTAILEGGD